MDGCITPDPDEADQQVVLEELYDENYEPTEAEILEYAKWLGMDTDNEKELLWIARAGLKEPVPEGWKPCQAPSKEIYYFNFITGESIWDHPCDEHFRKLYAQEKARLEERRQNEAADQQDAAAAGQQDEHAGQEQQLQQAGLQQDWGSQPDTGQQQQQHQQQQQQQQQHQQQQQQQQLVKAPMLQLPNSNAVQHTDVEAITSPSGTLSTIASGTTVSVAESPVGGLSHTTGAFQAEATKQQAGNERPSLADGIAPAGPAGLQVSPMLTPAAAQGARRSLMAGDAQGVPVLAAAARDWRATDAAADQQERQLFRQRLEQERQQWEQHLQSDVHTQHSALQQQHQERLWALTQELQEQEQLVAAQLKAEQESRVSALRMELQATLRELDQELQEAKAQHAAHMQQLRSQHEDLEAKANSMLQQAQQRLSATAVADSELSAARDKATAAVKMEALAEASGHRSELLQAALHAVEQEVAAEVASYKATRKAEALQQLAGRLPDDTAAAARQLERQTAELQRLEAAVADKAAVLEKLSEGVNLKQQQQQQQLLHSLSNSSERGGDVHALVDGREQLTAVQQQLTQAEKQLAVADAALLEKRAAVGEAGEQLAALRRETSVCEPRLGSLRQQLQELEANIRARTTEHQQRQADVALSSKRLAELREEVSRRQGQLDSLEALHAERQESLRQTANELSWRRGELSTLESSLSESLRRKADAEYQALEERLRRTRKAAADAAAELSSSQAALADLSAQVASKKGSLAGIEASLAAKSKELQEVLSQLQAAAAQEFQDAKKLLLKEEARLLESERRSMQLRVTDQIESERRAALAAGRRRLEREIAARLAGEQSASLEQQQKQVQRWLQAAAAGVPPWDTSPGGVAVSSPAANGGHDRAKGSQAAAASGLGVAALLGQEAAAAAQWPDRQQQQQASTRTSSSSSLPESGGATNVIKHAPPAAAAVAGDVAGDLGAVGKRRARSHSPVRNHSSAAAAAAVAAAQPSNTTATRPRQHSAAAAAGRADQAGSAAATVQRLSERLQAAAGREAEPAGGVAAGLHAAAAAVAEQLKALGGQLGPGSEPSSGWCADLPQLSLLAFPATPHTSEQVPGGMQLAAYTSLLHAAKQFVKQRRRDIQTRQEAVVAAQADWKAVLAAMEEQQELHQASGTPPPAELVQAVQQLRQLKGVLQEQIHALNDETQQVKGLKARVQQLRATIELLQLHAPQQEQPDPTGSIIANLLTSLSGLQHRQQHWQQQQQSGLVPSPRVPLQSHNHNQQQQLQQQPPWSSSLPPTSPLDKVSAALQAALDAATSYGNSAAAQAAGSAGSDAGGGAALSSGRGSRRTSLQPWPPNGAAGPAQSGHAPELAAEGSWGTLNKLREERGAAQQAMRQHSQWLQGFRQQVAQVAALQPVVAGKLYQQTHQGAGQGHVRKVVLQQSPVAAAEPAAAAANGTFSASLSAVASSSLLPTVQSSAGSLTMGQPLTVDLGSSDQLVIALMHKEATGSAAPVATA